MKINNFYSLIILVVFSLSAGAETSYVNLDVYKGQTYTAPQTDKLTHFLDRGWGSFVSSVKESVFADNLSSDQFWNTLRSSLAEGNFYNRLANFQATNNLKGADIVLKTIYSSVTQVPVQYMSVLPNGDSIPLSGKIFLPKNKQAKHIIIASHYTICADKEAPSNAYSIEGIYAIKDYIVLMPDYIGYGITDSLTHPYLHLKTSVSSAIDLLNAAIPYLNANQYTYYKSIILIGYSQGAAVTLALQKKLEEKYAGVYPINKVFAGAGPYDLAATFDFYLQQPNTDLPCTLPMLILGLNYGENLGLKREDFFQPFLMEQCPILIESKNYTLNDVNAALGKEISNLLKPVIYEKETYPTSILYEAVQKNIILHWTPQSDLFLFHSTTDNMVPYLNSEHIKQEFDTQQLENIEYDFAPYGNHMEAAITFFEKVYRLL